MPCFPNTWVNSALGKMVIGVCWAPSRSTATVSGTLGHNNNAVCLVTLKDWGQGRDMGSSSGSVLHEQVTPSSGLNFLRQKWQSWSSSRIASSFHLSVNFPAGIVAAKGAVVKFRILGPGLGEVGERALWLISYVCTGSHWGVHAATTNGPGFLSSPALVVLDIEEDKRFLP